MARPIQVDIESYRQRYMTLPRMITHWHQANVVVNAASRGGKVLEIGPGAGHTTWLLRQWGMEVTTLDFDPKITPNIVGDVTSLPIANDAFDCVLAAEVLEHIPFAEFGTALSELRRISKGYVVISLPAPFVGISALLNFSGLQERGMHFGVPFLVNHKFDGQHYWELGKRGYSISKVRDVIRSTGLKIVNEFRPAPSLYTYFFVMN